MPAKLAAGVIVLNGPRILAFARFDKPGLALPCGHVEPGEAIADAALREAREETGFELALVDKPPFVGFDMRDDGRVWRRVGEIDVIAVEFHPPMAKGRVIRYEQVKTGTQTAADATKQLNEFQTNVEVGASGTGTLVLEAQGTDITPLIDLSSVERNQGKTRGPAEKKGFDEGIGITTKDLDRVVKALYDLELRARDKK